MTSIAGVRDSFEYTIERSLQDLQNRSSSEGIINEGVHNKVIDKIEEAQKWVDQSKETCKDQPISFDSLQDLCENGLSRIITEFNNKKHKEAYANKVKEEYAKIKNEEYKNRRKEDLRIQGNEEYEKRIKEELIKEVQQCVDGLKKFTENSNQDLSKVKEFNQALDKSRKFVEEHNDKFYLHGKNKESKRFISMAKKKLQ